MSSKIQAIHSREILDSRGNPTVEVDVTLADGVTASASVPSGASTGKREAVELRDDNPRRYGGKGVLSAIDNINRVLAPALVGMDAADIGPIDQALRSLDGTPDKRRLGANAVLGVSLAAARAGAVAAGVPLFRHLAERPAYRLPVPLMNVLNGGVHAAWQGADIQEVMIAPVGAPTLGEAVRWGAEIYHALIATVACAGYPPLIGDEGGLVPAIKRNSGAIELVLRAIEAAGYRPGQEVVLALDVAASEWLTDADYQLRREGQRLETEQLIELYQGWVDRYPIALLEDGLGEDDWSGWQQLNLALGERIELVGDDLFVTNVELIRRGIEQGCANAVLIKPNQIGTVSETIAAAELAYSAGWGAMVSHRSGETVDSFIADLAVALNTGHIKAGAPCRGERVEKYNRLLRIAEILGDGAQYAGRTAFVRPV